MTSESILIAGGTLVSCEGTRAVERVGWLAIEGGRIADRGDGDAPANWQRRAGCVLDARNMAVVPGIVNGHTHLSQTFMRGLADDRSLLHWLKEIIWPVQAAMTPEEMHLAAMLGLAENLHCGATTVVQHHKLPHRAHVDAAAQAALDSGGRMVLAFGWVDIGAGAEPLDRILADLEWLHDRWHGAADGRIRVASGPLAAWRCSDEAMRETTALARSWGAPVHIHISEEREEVDLQLQRCGKRPIEWLADIGVLGTDVQLVHAVHVTDDELDLIAQSGATVVHCPTSNMYLASGAAPVRKMLNRGISVALGTDGSGSNNSQDVLECAKFAALLAKHTSGIAPDRPRGRAEGTDRTLQALAPGDVVRMLVSDGARLWDTRATGALGRLAPGAPADISIVNLNTVRCQPVHSATSALVYCASGSDVHTVIVGGRVLVDAGRLTGLDEEALFERCRRAVKGLMRRVGIGGS